MKRKRITDMDMVEINNFQRECKNYIIDNEQYIRELYQSLKDDGIHKTLSQCTITHYDATIEAWDDNEGILTKCQKKVFMNIAEHYFYGDVKWLTDLFYLGW